MNIDSDNLLQHRVEFGTVYGIISAHNEKKVIVPIESQILNVLFASDWSNLQQILSFVTFCKRV